MRRFVRPVTPDVPRMITNRLPTFLVDEQPVVDDKEASCTSDAEDFDGDNDESDEDSDDAFVQAERFEYDDESDEDPPEELIPDDAGETSEEDLDEDEEDNNSGHVTGNLPRFVFNEEH